VGGLAWLGALILVVLNSTGSIPESTLNVNGPCGTHQRWNRDQGPGIGLTGRRSRCTGEHSDRRDA